MFYEQDNSLAFKWTFNTTSFVCALCFDNHIVHRASYIWCKHKRPHVTLMSAWRLPSSFSSCLQQHWEMQLLRSVLEPHGWCNTAVLKILLMINKLNLLCWYLKVGQVVLKEYKWNSKVNYLSLLISACPLTCGSDALGWPYQGTPEERSLSASNLIVGFRPGSLLLTISNVMQ